MASNPTFLHISSPRRRLPLKVYTACTSCFTNPWMMRAFAVLASMLLDILLLALIYLQVFACWHAYIGHEVWDPAFPVPRTRFILLGFTVPIFLAAKTFLVAIAPGLAWLFKLTWAWISQYRIVKISDLRDPRRNDVSYNPVPMNEYDYADYVAAADDGDDNDNDDTDQEGSSLLGGSADVESYHRDQGRSRRAWGVVFWAKLIIFYACMYLLGLAFLTTYNAGYGTSRWRGVLRDAEAWPKKEGYGKGERIFITANFFNNAVILPRWTNELSRAINYWGTENVFVSISESYSNDDTPEILRGLHERLAEMDVEHRIIVKDSKIERPESMDTRMPRITFLSATRNRALEPLVQPTLRKERLQGVIGNSSNTESDHHNPVVGHSFVLHNVAEEMWYLRSPSEKKSDDSTEGRHQEGYFDRVLFSNDIFVEAEDFVELLESRDGDWDMVCGLDFQETGLYDSWVIRDSLGRIPSVIFPHFAADAGMDAALARKPVPVQACWNGVAAFRADPFLPVELRRIWNNGTDAGEVGSAQWYLSSEPLKDMPKSHPRHPENASGKVISTPDDKKSLPSPAQAPPLLFRPPSMDTGECFSSECFLLAYDLRMVFDMKSIWVNPNVVVTYKWEYYIWYRYILGHWAVRAWTRYAEGWDWTWRGWLTEWHAMKRFVRRSEEDGEDGLGISFDQPANPIQALARRDNDNGEVIGWGGRLIKGRERAMWDSRFIMGEGMYVWDGGECQPLQA